MLGLLGLLHLLGLLGLLHLLGHLGLLQLLGLLGLLHLLGLLGLLQLLGLLGRLQLQHTIATHNCNTHSQNTIATNNCHPRLKKQIKKTVIEKQQLVKQIGEALRGRTPAAEKTLRKCIEPQIRGPPRESNRIASKAIKTLVYSL